MAQKLFSTGPGNFRRAERKETIDRVPTGQGKLEKVREFEWSGKGQGKIFFLEKSGKMKISSSITVSFGSSQHGFCS